jgi:hypothetical protein
MKCTGARTVDGAFIIFDHKETFTVDSQIRCVAGVFKRSLRKLIEDTPTPCPTASVPESDRMLANWVELALKPNVFEFARLLPITSICFELAVRPVVPIDIAPIF